MSEHEAAFAADMRERWPDAIRRRGRVFDPGTGRWYKDGFAPFQLPEVIRATCGQCGGDLFIFARVSICRRCTYGETA